MFVLFNDIYAIITNICGTVLRACLRHMSVIENAVSYFCTVHDYVSN